MCYMFMFLLLFVYHLLCYESVSLVQPFFVNGLMISMCVFLLLFVAVLCVVCVNVLWCWLFVLGFVVGVLCEMCISVVLFCFCLLVVACLV